MNEIQDLSEQIDFSNLIYYCMGKSGPKDFIGFKGPLGFYKNINDGFTTLEKSEKKYIYIKSDIKQIVKGRENQKGKKLI